MVELIYKVIATISMTSTIVFLLAGVGVFAVVKLLMSTHNQKGPEEPHDSRSARYDWVRSN